MQMRGRGTVGGRYDGKGWAVAKSGAKWGRGYTGQWAETEGVGAGGPWCM